MLPRRTSPAAVFSCRRFVPPRFPRRASPAAAMGPGDKGSYIYGDDGSVMVHMGHGQQALLWRSPGDTVAPPEVCTPTPDRPESEPTPLQAPAEVFTPTAGASSRPIHTGASSSSPGLGPQGEAAEADVPFLHMSALKAMRQQHCEACLHKSEFLVMCDKCNRRLCFDFRCSWFCDTCGTASCRLPWGCLHRCPQAPHTLPATTDAVTPRRASRRASRYDNPDDPDENNPD